MANNDTQRRSSDAAAESKRTPYAWHFRKLMDQLEKIHDAIKASNGTTEQCSEE